MDYSQFMFGVPPPPERPAAQDEVAVFNELTEYLAERAIPLNTLLFTERGILEYWWWGSNPQAH